MPADLDYERTGFKWDADADSVIMSINDGRLYFLYRGHGFPEGWGLMGNNGAKFNSEHIDKLSNYDSMPIIFSLTCDTGDHRTENNFVRNLLGSPYGGAYSVFAQSSEGISGANDRLAFFLIDCIWPNPGLNIQNMELYEYWEDNPLMYNSLPALRLGQMLDIATDGTASYYSLSNDITSLGLYKKHITHCFGDPSILFKKQVPKPIEDVNVSRNSETSTVYVSSLGFDRKMKYFSFYDKTTDKSYLYRGTNASYTSPTSGGEKYVDVLVYNSDYIPYFDQGENYEGFSMSENESRLISHSLHTDGKYLTVNYYLSERDRDKRVELVVHDLETNDLIYNSSLDPSICGIEASASVYVNNGMMMISLMINGTPYSTMKVFVPLH